jgi:hypothetical protein
MNINTRRTLFLAVLTLTFLPVLANAQGMCIPTPIKVKKVKGQVLFGYEGNRRPLPDVTVELARQSKPQKIIASTITDQNGHFQLEGINPGRYWLKTKHSQVIGIEVELKVVTGGRGNKRHDHNGVIIFVLGADPSKTCGGGDVEVIKH